MSKEKKRSFEKDIVLYNIRFPHPRLLSRVLRSLSIGRNFSTFNSISLEFQPVPLNFWCLSSFRVFVLMTLKNQYTPLL